MNWAEIKRVVWRFIRVAAGQIIALLITQTMGVELPIVSLSVGAVLNAIFKYLRDKFNLDWIPL
jgi:hypothetical protein